MHESKKSFGVLPDAVTTLRPATSGHSRSSLHSQPDIVPLPLICLDGFSSYVRMKSDCLISVSLFRNVNSIECHKEHLRPHLETSFCVHLLGLLPSFHSLFLRHEMTDTTTQLCKATYPVPRILLRQQIP